MIETAAFAFGSLIWLGVGVALVDRGPPRPEGSLTPLEPFMVDSSNVRQPKRLKHLPQPGLRSPDF